MERDALKKQVQEHWEEETCGTRYGHGEDREAYFDEIYRSRYERTGYLREFAGFGEGRGKRVLEIGVGAGSDFRSWVENGARVTGIDLTEAAVALTAEHLKVKGLHAAPHELRRADAEHLPFADGTFDIVYSYGVFHHTPNPAAALNEAHRVLKPGGEMRAMIYHAPSWTGFLLWVRWGLLAGRPFASQKRVVFERLESPGTKAYRVEEARALVASAGFRVVSAEPRLCPGDLLNILPSERYRGWTYRLAWRLYPRWLVALLGDRFGLNLLIRATRRESRSRGPDARRIGGAAGRSHYAPPSTRSRIQRASAIGESRFASALQPLRPGNAGYPRRRAAWRHRSSSTAAARALR